MWSDIWPSRYELNICHSRITMTTVESLRTLSLEDSIMHTFDRECLDGIQWRLDCSGWVEIQKAFPKFLV